MSLNKLGSKWKSLDKNPIEMQESFYGIYLHF